MKGRQHTLPFGTVRGELTHRTAAPEGGARWPLLARVRGCVAFLSICLASTAAVASDAQPGLDAALDEVLLDQVGAEDWVRFRFLAPALTPDTADFDRIRTDLQALCDTVALPYVLERELAADMIVVSLMDRPVPFGEIDPDALQLFEAFRIVDGTCIWEPF